jgi:hypothetical protein
MKLLLRAIIELIKRRIEIKELADRITLLEEEVFKKDCNE